MQKRATVKSVCLECNKSFDALVQSVKIGFGKYCSKTCRNKVGGRASTANSSGSSNNNWKGGISKDRYRYKKADRVRNTAQHKAREAVRRAVKSGKLVRPDRCSNCSGKSQVQGHHTDYSLQLQVVWLCDSCHRLTHEQ